MDLKLPWDDQPTTVLPNSKTILQNYILRPDIPILDPLPEIIPRKPQESRLYYCPNNPASTTLVPKRAELTGKIVDFVEVEVQDAGANPKNSMSLLRSPGPLTEATRGSAMNFPFWPACLDEPSKEVESINIDSNFDFGDELLTVAPGLPYGLFEDAKKQHKFKISYDSTVNLLDALEESQEIQNWLKSESQAKETTENDVVNSDGLVVDSLLADDLKPQLIISTAEPIGHWKWAQKIDITQPVPDWSNENMVKKYGFDLDNFQKYAILKLEERNHVFVAAHTSAGKTVIAEYAIALSQKHMTKAIYTSPIKALSNQKYRDFKEEFKDVGLITGDIQINSTAPCLIMTTEILRSMLYCGSDTIRDMEYVIFDEVHYINDSERGHVWEEVLILLPQHVVIIMLSATVPNVYEFAEWVGSTRKQIVCVISTFKRPVPLVHSLYIPLSATFLVKDASERFLKDNYSEAEFLFKEYKTNMPKEFKGKPKELKQKAFMRNLIKFLKTEDKLPAVVFIFSRKKCDSHLKLCSNDLTTFQEKEQIKEKFQKWISKLKVQDQEIPQVKMMRKSLQNGIGVHHSGILPILKEIIEMLFQEGLVKLLFATETFAMGVNMPARTVVFESFKKFDGIAIRNLQPAEYTQMAGRAGRRQHDPVGFVYISCEIACPPIDELKSMILSQPQMLKSQFQLKYSTILTLLRNEFITVEHLMSQSFMEFKSQKSDKPQNMIQQKLTEEKISQLKELGEHLKPFCEFYHIATKYIECIEKLRVKILSKRRDLKPGKVLVISQGRHFNKLGIILSTQLDKKILKVFILDQKDAKVGPQLDRGEMWYKMLSLSPKYQRFHPDNSGEHCIVNITYSDIQEITKSSINIDPDKIINNVEQRQIARFKDAPPSQTVINAINDLINLTKSYNSNSSTVQIENMFAPELAQAWSSLESLRDNEEAKNEIKQLKKQLKQIYPSINMPNFEQEFLTVYERKELEQRLETLKFSNSPRSMTLYPNYCQKLKLLERMKYIDEHHEVTLKGRVACQMGQNELIITELVLRDIFTGLTAAEIAALLSGLVFQGKIDEKDDKNKDNKNKYDKNEDDGNVDRNSRSKRRDKDLGDEIEKTKERESYITNNLKKCMKEMMQVDEEISKLETEYEIDDNDCSRLNFGLIEVVYLWAQDKPFVTIMQCTQTPVQEGIIVRCIQQLNEILRDVKSAAMTIGNPTLQTKMEDASKSIKRDIVFAASLYIQD